MNWLIGKAKFLLQPLKISVAGPGRRCALLARLFLLGLFFAFSPILFCQAAEPGALPADASIVNTQWGGYLRGIATATYPDSDNFLGHISPDPYYDGQMAGRLKNETFIGSRWAFETHVEAYAIAGDTLERVSRWQDAYPDPGTIRLFSVDSTNDAGRLLNLTHIFGDQHRYRLVTRFDRLNVSYSPAWGSMRIGRQALTWGNGMLFNPMDLFNPFSPTTVMRDYKLGDDMVNVQYLLDGGEVQVVYVPHRDPENAEIRDRESIYAGKWHATFNHLDTDLMVARHYADQLLGVGASGYLGGSAWRINAVYTQAQDQAKTANYLQGVINMDYAWQWFGQNVYGFMEFYYNSSGVCGDYGQAWSDPYTLQRLERGDQFTLGQSYLAGQIQWEHHPLVHSQWTVLANLSDPSGLVQPQLMLDLTTNWQLVCGAMLYWGAPDTEFGGFSVSSGTSSLSPGPSDRIYLWLTYYF